MQVKLNYHTNGVEMTQVLSQISETLLAPHYLADNNCI